MINFLVIFIFIMSTLLNIRELREKLELSQQALADKTGISKSKIGQWEIGNGNPKVEDFKILINFFTRSGLVVEGLELGNINSEIKKRARVAYINIQEAKKALVVAQEQLEKANDEFFKLDIFSSFESDLVSEFADQSDKQNSRPPDEERLHIEDKKEPQSTESHHGKKKNISGNKGN